MPAAALPKIPSHHPAGTLAPSPAQRAELPMPSAVYRLEIGLQPQHLDPLGNALLSRIQQMEHLPIKAIRTAQVLLVPAAVLMRQNLPSQSPFFAQHSPADAFLPNGQPNSQTLLALAQTLFADDVLNLCGVNGQLLIQPSPLDFAWNWWIEILPAQGVTDPQGSSAQRCLEWYLNTRFKPQSTLRSGRAWLLQGDLNQAQAQHIAAEVSNPLVHRVRVLTPSQAAKALQSQHTDLFPALTPPPSSLDTVEHFALPNPQALLHLSKQRLLAFNAPEAQAIVAHFGCASVQARRKAAGLGSSISDVELEMLAQTWSEHCKHKIFQAHITYHPETGATQRIDSLFNTYIRSATQQVRQQLGQADFCLSVFSDNAGVVRLNDEWSLALKVETHNSPSALDPYGGALTGILGVNRDAFGTGRGADLLFNTNVFCFASPFYPQPLPRGLLHPKRIYEGVRLGVEHGGNKCGVPTVNGSLTFDARFLGKPLVFCGSAALLPSQLHGRAGHQKWVEVGSRVVMVGGRIGRDGIHGATFSSLELGEEAPAGAVQIGDPIVQKMMFDFLLCARDQGLYTAITDNGAGGLSSSVGEMAQLSGQPPGQEEASPFDAPVDGPNQGGADLHLDRAPLKHPNLTPWEVLVSESQERMTLAVPPKHLPALLALAQQMGVEATDLGEFTDHGALQLFWKGRLVGALDMAFLHHGVPQMRLHAKAPVVTQSPITQLPRGDLTPWLLRVLGHLNVCSKERVVRQYDHEVQANTVIKPLCGAQNDGPSDAAVLRPLPNSWQGVAVAHGLCPRYGDLDAYHMAACALDEAVRSLVCVGADPNRLAALDNFCWCDPLPASNNPQAEQRLGQLVQCAKGLHDHAVHYGIPLISGKDSMKNDYVQGELRISIPPTLLVSAVGFLDDVRQAVSMDAKAAGDLVWLAGTCTDALGAGEFSQALGAASHPSDGSPQPSNFNGNFNGSGFVPKVDPITNRALYQALHQAICAGLVRSAHDCSDGGLAVALAECAFAGGLGMQLNLYSLQRQSQLSPAVLLFAESPGRVVFTSKPEHKARLQGLFQHQPFSLLGQVTQHPQFVIEANPLNATNSADPTTPTIPPPNAAPSFFWINTNIQHLKNAWQTPLSQL